MRATTAARQVRGFLRRALRLLRFRLRVSLLGRGRNVGQDNLDVVGVAGAGDGGEVAAGPDQRECVVLRAVAGAGVAVRAGELVGLMSRVDDLEHFQAGTGLVEGGQVASGQRRSITVASITSSSDTPGNLSTYLKGTVTGPGTGR